MKLGFETPYTYNYTKTKVKNAEYFLQNLWLSSRFCHVNLKLDTDTRFYLGCRWVDLGDAKPRLAQVQTMLGHMLMLILISLGADRAMTPK